MRVPSVCADDSDLTAAPALHPGCWGDNVPQALFMAEVGD